MYSLLLGMPGRSQLPFVTAGCNAITNFNSSLFQSITSVSVGSWDGRNMREEVLVLLSCHYHLSILEEPSLLLSQQSWAQQFGGHCRYVCYEGIIVMLLDLSSLQLLHCAPCWHPKWLLLPLFLSEISLSCKKTRIACKSPSMSNFWGQGQLIWNAPFGVDGDIPTHAAGTWWLTAWVLPKQPLCGPVVPPISGAQGAAFHRWQEIIALTAAADINGTAQASERSSAGQRQPGLARVVLL